MRSLQILTVLAFASSLVFVSSPARAQDPATGDPVADAARKARQEKKAAAKPKKVFTDDDVTPKPAEHHMEWYERPKVIAVVLIVMVVTLNIIFR